MRLRGPTIRRSSERREEFMVDARRIVRRCGNGKKSRPEVAGKL